jgi:hypothetical protein
MGYDMVRINKDGENLPVNDYNDDNYFRLNIWGMGRARNLALWGHGISSATELLNQEKRMHDHMSSYGSMVSDKKRFEPAELIQTILNAQANLVKETSSMLEHWATELTDESYTEDYASFLDPFGSNWNQATSEQCSVFAEGILNALIMIEASKAVPETLSNLETFREFAEWLNASPHGVFVG